MYTGKLDLPTLGRYLARVDKHLLETLKVRIGFDSLSIQVAEVKMAQEGSDKPPSVVRKEIEDQRLALAASWAEELGIDPDFAAALIYFIITEGCKIQGGFIHQHFAEANVAPNNPQAVSRFHRQELLDLTKAVAPVYDKMYEGEAVFGSRIHTDFESVELSALVRSLSNGNLNLALDLGCATGQQTLYLGQTFKKVIGYDVSPDMIRVARKAKKLKGASNVSFPNPHDLEEGLPQHKDNSVSLVVMNYGTASDVQNITGLLREIERILIPGGKFLLSFYNAKSLYSQIGFLPWPPPVNARIDPDRNCLDVQYGQRIYLIQARPYDVPSVEHMIYEANLFVDKLLTHPTVSSVLPQDILSTETFGQYNQQQATARRYHQAVIKKEKNKTAGDMLKKIDEVLSHSLQYGAYIIVTGSKA